MSDTKGKMSDPRPQEDKPDDTSGPEKDFGQVLDLDDAVLRAQGREAELKRSFSWVGAIGLAYR